MATRTQIDTFERLLREVANKLGLIIMSTPTGREREYWSAANIFFLEMQQNVTNAKQLAMLEERYGR